MFRQCFNRRQLLNGCYAGGTAAAVWGLVEPYDYHVFGERYTDAAFLGGAALCHLVRIPAWREQLRPHWCVSLIASC